MKTYIVLYAEDVPHYCTVEIQAAGHDDAINAAKARHTGDLDFDDPDWENPILRRIVNIQDSNYVDIANDIPLDGHQLLIGSTVRDAIQYALECLGNFKVDWLANHGLGIAVEKLAAANAELGGAA
jgi:hypothetical protein